MNFEKLMHIVCFQCSAKATFWCHLIHKIAKCPALLLGKFKKNVTVQFFYPHALNMEYFYLNLSLKGVF